MSKSQKLQFLAKVQECCRSDDTTLQQIESLAREFSQEHGIPLHETLSLKDPRKRTILHYVCRSSTSDLLVGPILEWFPDSESCQTALKQKDKEGLTCLMMAVQQSEAERRVLQLLQVSPKLGLVRSKAGATALHYAAGAGATRTTLEALWEHGKVALQTFALQGGTPLHWACSSSKDIPETIQTLIECGADVNASSPGGETGAAVPTPLTLALAVGKNANVCALLESSEIAVDRVLTGGKTTFFHMVVEQNLSDALGLILAKLDENKKEILQHKDKNGRTPLDIAIEQRKTVCIELLHQASGSPEHGSDSQPFSTGAEKEIQKQSPPNRDETLTEEESSDAMTPEEKQALDLWVHLKDLPEASQESAESALASKGRGNEHFQRKEWQQAHGHYSRAIESNPKDATFYANRSACRIQLKNPRGALLDALLARKLRPKWTKACYRKAVALLELHGHQDAALAAYEGLRIEPANVELKKLLRTIVKKGREAFQKSKEAIKDTVEPS